MVVLYFKRKNKTTGRHIMWGDIAIAFLLAFITSFVITPYTIRLAKKVGAIDLPKDERRINKKPMPRLGGLAVIAGFLVSFIYLIIILKIEGNLNLRYRTI
jgi:UDP-GlcNAc:undecaprenyl-phosphate GlcNAc-1-phosphate transferase